MRTETFRKALNTYLVDDYDLRITFKQPISNTILAA